MSGRVKVTWDRDGVSEWMKANLADATRSTAESLAERVRSETDAPVTVEHYTTDRPHSTVMVHRGGAAREAKRGHLKRAATALGLDVAAPGGRGGRQGGAS